MELKLLPLVEKAKKLTHINRTFMELKRPRLLKKSVTK